MRELMWLMPVFVTAAMLRPGNLAIVELDASTGGAECTHKDVDDVECTRSVPTVPCSGEVPKCYGQPTNDRKMTCNIEGADEMSCQQMPDCLETRGDDVTEPNCTMPSDPGGGGS
jgi:hypothetical protein